MRAKLWSVARVLLPGAFALALDGCSGVPLVLDPHGSNAHETAQLAWVLFVGASIIFLLVMGLAAYALTARLDRRAWLSSRRFVIVSGIILPVVTLSALLFYALRTTAALAAPGAVAPLRIEVIGEMWWWRVHYLDADGARMLAAANEVHVPAGRTVELTLKSADVLHSFWVPQLAGKLDLIPGRTTVLKLRADRAGVYRGQCAEYCGAQHAKMAFHVVAHAAQDFEQWLGAQRKPAKSPTTPALLAGLALFVAHCGACHAVRGTPAAGTLGPDLTHLASRRFLAAGTLPNNAGTLSAWIASTQHVKPESRMPAFPGFSSDELRSLSSYLMNLE